MLDYTKIQKMVLDGMKKNRIKLGTYQNDFCIAVDDSYLLIVPHKEFLFDAMKVLKACHQETAFDGDKLFSYLNDSKELVYTGFSCRYENTLYRYYKTENGEEVKVKDEPFKYIDKWSDPMVTKAPGRATPCYLYTVGHITTLVGIIMPAYFKIGD